MKILSLSLLLVSQQSIFGQNIVVTGRILDETNQQPVAFANIGISECGIGTISNDEGYFRLVIPEKAIKYNLYFKQIGYNPKHISLADVKRNSTILLTPAPLLMKEVLVVPDNFIKNLITNAFDSIEKNYPLRPTLYTGFYRDAQFYNDSIYLVFIEAILSVFKDSYLNSHGTGQISIQKSRRYTRPGMDSINNVQFYGGAFMPLDFDFVYTRAGFLNPRHYNKYTYKVIETKSKDGKDTYTIEYSSKQDTSETPGGNFVLDKKTLAYVEINGTKNIAKKNFQLTPFRWKNIEYKVRYMEFQGKWHLSYAFIQSEGYNIDTKKEIFKEKEFVTTTIRTDSVNPIPFNDQLQYSDVINLKAEDYASSNWKDYTILEPSGGFRKQTILRYDDDESKEIFSESLSAKSSKNEKVLCILKKINYRMGFNIAPYASSNSNFTLSYTDKNSNSIDITKQIRGHKFYPSLTSEIIYKINQHYSLFFQARSSIDKMYKLNDWNWGIRYTSLVFPSNANWKWNFDLKYSHFKLQLKYGETKNNADINISNKSFDASKINIYAGKYYSGISPSFAITRKIGRLLSFYIETNYFIKTKKKDIVSFSEASGFFLSRKSKTVPLTTRGITLLKNSVNTTETSVKMSSPWNISFGITFDI